MNSQEIRQPDAVRHEGKPSSLGSEAMLAAGFIAGSLATQNKSMRLPLLLAAGGLAAWHCLTTRRRSGSPAVAKANGVQTKPPVSTQPQDAAEEPLAQEEVPVAFTTEEEFLRQFLANQEQPQPVEEPSQVTVESVQTALAVESVAEEAPVVFQTEEDFLRHFLGADSQAPGPEAEAEADKLSAEAVSTTAADFLRRFQAEAALEPSSLLSHAGSAVGEEEIIAELVVPSNDVPETCVLPEVADAGETGCDTTLGPLPISSPADLVSHSAAWLLGLEPLPVVQAEAMLSYPPPRMAAEIPDVVEIPSEVSEASAAAVYLQPSVPVDAVLGRLFEQEPGPEPEQESEPEEVAAKPESPASSLEESPSVGIVDSEPENITQAVEAEPEIEPEPPELAVAKTPAWLQAELSHPPLLATEPPEDSDDNLDAGPPLPRPRSQPTTAILPRRVVPRAPATVTVEDGKKSWLGWWR